MALVIFETIKEILKYPKKSASRLVASLQKNHEKRNMGEDSMLEALVGISCDACIRSDKKFTTHIAFKYYIKGMRKEKGNERSQGKLKNFKIFLIN